MDAAALTSGPEAFLAGWRDVAFRAHSGDDEASSTKQRTRRLGVDFKRASEKVFAFEAGPGRVVCVEQMADHEGLGAVVWDCGVMQCRALAWLGATLGHDWLRSTDVLELGSGTGAVGLTAAALGARSTVLSDRPLMLDLLRANVERNVQAGLVKPGTVDVRALEWGGGLACSRAFSLVLCSDVLYDAGSFPALLATLKVVVRPGAAVLFTVKLRFPEREEGFFAGLESQGWSVWAIQPSHLGPNAMEGVAVLVALAPLSSPP